MKRTNIWAFGLIKEELTSDTQDGIKTTTRRLTVAGLPIRKSEHTESVDKPKDHRKQHPDLGDITNHAHQVSYGHYLESPKPGEYTKQQVEALALQIEKEIALRLPVTTEWVKNHFHGHLINNLNAGLDPAHIRDVVAKMAAKKAARQKGGRY